MSVFGLILTATTLHAGYFFPPDYPANDARAITEIRDLYLRNIQPDYPLPLKTEAGDWNELKVQGLAAGLVIGLELNHRRLSPVHRRLTFEAIGLLVLRAIRDRGLMGEPTPDQTARVGTVRIKRFRLTDDDRVRSDFEKLLDHRAISPANRFSAAGLIRAIADGRRLPQLREQAEFVRSEASELLTQVLERQPPFALVEFSFDEAQRLVLLLREFGGPHLIERLTELRRQPTLVRKFAAEAHVCELALRRRR